MQRCRAMSLMPSEADIGTRRQLQQQPRQGPSAVRCLRQEAAEGAAGDPTAQPRVGSVAALSPTKKRPLWTAASKTTQENGKPVPDRDSKIIADDPAVGEAEPETVSSNLAAM
jgi:hypothetical protein